MIDKIPVSVFIIAKDEADRIGATIKSVRDWADEVIVIDSGSTDETVSLSDALGARVLFNEWKGYGPQKNFGESLCKNEWLLNLDADEEVTPQLRDSIISLFAKGVPKHKAYRLKRKILFRLEDKPPLLAPGDKPVRLYHKGSAGFKDSTVHDSVEIYGPDKTAPLLKGILLHRCFRNLEHWCYKINFYSTMQAEDYVQRRRRPSDIRILIEPVLSFLKAYFLRRYFLYGIDGFVGSMLYAHARMLRMAKVRELVKERRYNARHGI